MNLNTTGYELNTTMVPYNVLGRSNRPYSHSKTRVFHMQKNSEMYTNSIRLEYDPWIGIQTAAILGSCLVLITAYILYKAKCRRQTWYSEDELYMKVYRRKIEQLTGKKYLPPNDKNKNGSAVNSRKSFKKPLATMDSLEQTAKWIQSQPLDSGIPEALENAANLRRLCPTCSMRDIRTIACVTPLLSRKVDKNFCVRHGKNTHLCTAHCSTLQEEYVTIQSPKEFLATVAIETPKDIFLQPLELCQQVKEPVQTTLAIPDTRITHLGSSQSLPISFTVDNEKNKNLGPSVKTLNHPTTMSNKFLSSSSRPGFVLASPGVIRRPSKLFPETNVNENHPLLSRTSKSEDDNYLETSRLLSHHPKPDICASSHDPMDFNDCHSLVNRREKNSDIEPRQVKRLEAADSHLSDSLEGAVGIDTNFKVTSEIELPDYKAPNGSRQKYLQPKF